MGEITVAKELFHFCLLSQGLKTSNAPVDFGVEDGSTLFGSYALPSGWMGQSE